MLLFSRERASPDDPATPVLLRMTQILDAKSDNMLLSEWQQGESDCDRRQHGRNKQTGADGQVLNTANVPQQMPQLNKT